MRPLLLSNFNHVFGGGEVGVVMLAEGLVERGHPPLVALPGKGPLCQGMDRLLLSLDPLQASRQLREAAESFDLIHTYGVRGMTIAAAANTGKPLILHLLVPNANPHDQLLASRAAAVICNSHATAKRLVDDRKVHVIYNGVSPHVPATTPLLSDPARRTIGIIGPTVPRKGQLDALPALKQVLDALPDVDVAFVGRIVPPASWTLRAAAKESNGRIKLLGYVPNVAVHLGEFALIIVPSRSEGFGRVAVEAMRAGTPVLVARIEGLVEAVAGLNDPFLPDERAEWGERIRLELEAPAHTPGQLLAAAIRFDPARFADEIMAVYSQVLDGH